MTPRHKGWFFEEGRPQISFPFTMDVDVSSTPPMEDPAGSSNPIRSISATMGSQASIGRKPHLSPPTDRLMVTNLILENFKSYAGAQEIGPLHHCFTAVVGPNGSGKSNVIDAILFVFGHQAKKLRHARVAELIHKSEAHPNCPYAKVSVHFQRIINTSVRNRSKLSQTNTRLKARGANVPLWATLWAFRDFHPLLSFSRPLYLWISLLW
jgi:hypothetical protein